MRTLLLALALLGAGCATTPRTVPAIGTARVASDFASYDVRRVGVLPPQGDGLDAELALCLRDALAASFQAETPYEMLPLGPVELESLATLQPARTGRTQPEAVIALARRAALDALLTVRVVDLRVYEPVRLGIEVDLVAVETGLVIWSGSVHVDTGDRATRAAVEAWQEVHRSGGDAERAVDMLSPRRMGEFAAYQAALLL